MKRKMISKIIAAALIGTMCAGMATTVMAADDEKVTLSVINYHVGTDYAAEYYSYLFEAFQQTEEGKNVEFSFEEIPTTDAFNQKIKLLISSGALESEGSACTSCCLEDFSVRRSPIAAASSWACSSWALISSQINLV